MMAESNVDWLLASIVTNRIEKEFHRHFEFEEHISIWRSRSHHVYIQRIVVQDRRDLVWYPRYYTQLGGQRLCQPKSL